MLGRSSGRSKSARLTAGAGNPTIAYQTPTEENIQHSTGYWHRSSILRHFFAPHTLSAVWQNLPPSAKLHNQVSGTAGI
jgi:hypothetical protein